LDRTRRSARIDGERGDERKGGNDFCACLSCDTSFGAGLATVGGECPDSSPVFASDCRSECPYVVCLVDEACLRGARGDLRNERSAIWATGRRIVIEVDGLFLRVEWAGGE
jgi:hypothetical protein